MSGALSFPIRLHVLCAADRELLAVDDRTGIVFAIIKEDQGRHMAPRYVFHLQRTPCLFRPAMISLCPRLEGRRHKPNKARSTLVLSTGPP